MKRPASRGTLRDISSNKGLFAGVVAAVSLAAPPPSSAALPAPCGPLQYGGEGTPDVLIASDFPLSARFDSGEQNANAVRLVLEQHGWRAGPLAVGLHSCDNATRSAGRWSPARCAANARGYATTPKVVAVIGPFNSGCAAVQIPVLNTAPGGGVPLVSPSNTFVCLTRSAPGCWRTEPDVYYPTGVRTYLRVSGHDLFQGAGLARFARQRSLRRVYVLHDRSAYGLMAASAFRAAARRAGVRTVGFGSWNPRAGGYRALMRAVGRRRPQAILLAGLVESNGGRLIRDKVAVLGANSGRVRLLATDGFTTDATVAAAGPRAARGLLGGVTGMPPEFLPAPGAAFVRAFTNRFGVRFVDPYAPYSAQATEMVLAALAAGDGSRAAVLSHLFSTPVTNGLIGSFGIDPRGDPTTTHLTVWKVVRGSWRVARILPVPASLLR